jgi:hypothetical protein
LQLRQQRFRALRRRIGSGHAQGRTALDDRTVKKTPRRRHCHQRRDLACSTRRAEDRDRSGISAEGFDVVANPAQCRDEIEHARVVGRVQTLPAKLSKVEVAEDVETVRDCDEDDVAASY